MHKSFLPLLALATPVCAIMAADITGLVTDDIRQPLPGASVELKSLSDSTLRKFTFADDSGAFSIPDLPAGRYSLQFSMVGMEPASRIISLSDSDSTVSLKDIVLAESGINLKETVVTAVRAAVTAKQDTLEFNAGSYHTNPNASVGDLIKKLPGVEVDKDGSITSGGKSIKKILVDGKEFFGDDPTMATKNLSSNMVEKVQVIDRKSDVARLTGVDDGEEETVINLTIKKNMKNGWFGTVSGAGGTDSRYDGNFNVSTFKNDNQVSIVGGANNVNDLGFQDAGRARFRSFGPSGGITTSQRLGVNFNVGKEEIFRVGGNIFYSHTHRKANTFSQTQNLFADSVSTSVSGQRSSDDGHALNANFRMQWNIDPENTVEFRPTFYYNSRRSLLADSTSLHGGDLLAALVNRQRSNSVNKGDSYSITGDLIYNHKFSTHPGRSFSTQLKYAFSNTREHTTSLTDIELFRLDNQDETLFRYLDGHDWSHTGELRLTWTEPIGDVARGNFLTAAYNIRLRNNDADRYTYNLSPELLPSIPSDIPELTKAPDGILAADSLSNRFRNRFLSQELRIGYKKVAPKYNLEAGISASPSYSKSTDLIFDARNIPSRTVWNVAPFLRLRYKFSKTASLRLNYRARTSAPSSKQLQPVADVSDPMHVVVGNPSLKPSFSQSIMGNFSRFSADTQQSLMAMVNAQLTLNSIVSRTVSDPSSGARTTTYANANGDFNLMAMAMLHQPFSNRKWRYSAQCFARYASTPGYINGDFNRSGNFNITPRIGLTFSSDVFQMTVNPTYGFQMALNTLQRQPNRYIHTYGFSADGSLYLPFGLQLSSDIAFDNSTGYGAGFETAKWLWNAQLSYSLLRSKALTIFAKAYDILGRNKSISRSVESSRIVDSSSNTLTRYVMLGLSYTFNTMGGKSNAKDGFRPDDGMPPPGGRPQGPPPGAPGPRF